MVGFRMLHGSKEYSFIKLKGIFCYKGLSHLNFKNNIFRMRCFFMGKLKCSNFSKKTIFIQVRLLEIMIISFGQANLI